MIKKLDIPFVKPDDRIDSSLDWQYSLANTNYIYEMEEISNAYEDIRLFENHNKGRDEPKSVIIDVIQ